MPSMSDNFAQCFCWNTTADNWCGGTDDFWKSASCTDYAWQATAVLIPAILIALIAFFFPFFFCCCRYLCNCCGGKEPTKGLCCPGTRDEDRRVYHNTSIVIAKVCFISAFAGALYYSVGVIQSNYEVTQDVMSVSKNLLNATDGVFTMLNTTTIALNNLSRSGTNRRGFPNPQNQQQAVVIANDFNTRKNQIHDAMGQVHTIEQGGWDNHGEGRSNIVYQIIGCVLLVAVIALFLMLCNAKQAFVGVMFFLSWGLSAILIAFCAHLVLAQVTGPMCENYMGTFVPVVTGAIKAHGGCDNTQLTAIINSTAVNFQDYTSDPTGSLCDAVQLLCQGGTRTVFNITVNWDASFDCPYNPCDGNMPRFPSSAYPLSYFANISNYWIPNVTNFRTFINTATAKNRNMTCGKYFADACTVPDCAEFCPHSSDDSLLTIQRVSKFLNEVDTQYSDAVGYIVWTAMAQNYNCSDIYAALEGPLHNALCDGLSKHMLSISVALGMTSIMVALLSMASIRGIKRFNGLKARLGQALRQTAYVVDAKANGATRGDLDDIGRADAPVTAVVIRPEFYMQVSGEGKTMSDERQGKVASGGAADMHPLLGSSSDDHHHHSVPEQTALVSNASSVSMKQVGKGEAGYGGTVN